MLSYQFVAMLESCGTFERVMSPLTVNLMRLRISVDQICGHVCDELSGLVSRRWEGLP